MILVIEVGGTGYDCGAGGGLVGDAGGLTTEQVLVDLTTVQIAIRRWWRTRTRWSRW